MKSSDEVRIFPLGDSALTVEFGTVISEDLNRLAISLAEHCSRRPFEGFIEAAPAYASTTIFYDLVTTRRAHPQFPSAFAGVSSFVQRELEDVDHDTQAGNARKISIPVKFGGDEGPDLAIVADFAKLAESEVIDIFTSTNYRVYMLGFLPGFSYMGEVDQRIATPRKDSPRTSVPKGSVGIASRQTGIYSLTSPGGWQIIGQTSLEMYTPDREEPTFLRPGDAVRFTAT